MLFLSIFSHLQFDLSIHIYLCIYLFLAQSAGAVEFADCISDKGLDTSHPPTSVLDKHS